MQIKPKKRKKKKWTFFENNFLKMKTTVKASDGSTRERDPQSIFGRFIAHISFPFSSFFIVWVLFRNTLRAPQCKSEQFPAYPLLSLLAKKKKEEKKLKQLFSCAGASLPTYGLHLVPQKGTTKVSVHTYLGYSICRANCSEFWRTSSPSPTPPF